MRMTEFPLVTIITVTFNCALEIEDTIESILNQKNKTKLQYIVIDGMSTDGTVDIIKKYHNEIDIWRSEPDNGIYDGMNKGWELAKGSYVLFVNAGDLLLNLPIDLLNKALDDNISLVSGIVKDQNDNLTFSKFNSSIKFKNTLPHQGVLYRSTIQLRYNTKYKVFSDFDMNQRLFKLKKSWLNSDTIICIHDTNGISNRPTFFYEVYQIINENFGYYYEIKAWVYHKMMGINFRLNKLIYV